MIICISIFVFLIVYGIIRYKVALHEANWKVRWEDLIYGDQVSNAPTDLKHRLSVRDPSVTIQYIETAYYKGNMVALKKLRRKSFIITSTCLLEIKAVKELENDHLCRFIGASTEAPHQCLIYEYCHKGSMKDILENDSVKLDWMMRYSLLQDLIRGMEYLHNSDVVSHGNLRSSNCLINNRFLLKVSNFGLHSLRDKPAEHEKINYLKKLWMSPELLRNSKSPPSGTRAGDVYSFAIICQEVIYRKGVFYIENTSFMPENICMGLIAKTYPLVRPTLHTDNCPSDVMASLVAECWSEEPENRPDFTDIKAIFEKINKRDSKKTIMDNILLRMEQYANNLEVLAEERTADYMEQKTKSESLLYMMIPKKAAMHLMCGESVEPEAFDCVTIFFSDIHQFAMISDLSSPMQIINLLNDLYTLFDKVIESYDVYKVETFLDSYMVVSGLPVENGKLHAREISRMSLALLRATSTFHIKHLPEEKIRLRIGIYSGPVCAGVVGHKMPRYRLFGDTVNTASRMETNGEHSRIHIGETTKHLLDDIGGFLVELRDTIFIKGKGKMTTYWLIGKSKERERISSIEGVYPYKKMSSIDLMSIDSGTSNDAKKYLTVENLAEDTSVMDIAVPSNLDLTSQTASKGPNIEFFQSSERQRVLQNKSLKKSLKLPKGLGPIQKPINDESSVLHEDIMQRVMKYQDGFTG